MLKLLLGICYIIFLVGLFCRAGKYEKSPEPDQEEPETGEDRTYVELSEKIKILNERKQKIDMMNEMIADVWECSPGQIHKSIIVKIPENGHEYSFMLTGEDDISKLFVEIFETERDEQHTSLRREISQIR